MVDQVVSIEFFLLALPLETCSLHTLQATILSLDRYIIGAALFALYIDCLLLYVATEYNSDGLSFLIIKLRVEY